MTSSPPQDRQWRPTIRWYGREALTRAVSGLVFAVVALQFGAHLTGHDGPLQWLLKGNHIGVYFSVIGALLVLGGIGGAVRTVRERVVMHRLARRPGWSYQRRSPGLDERWSRPPFHGRDTKVGPLAEGPLDGAWCRVFGYRYTTGSGENSSRHQTCIITVELPGPLPFLSVGPESLRGAVAPGLARPDVDTENETFNRRYRVREGEPAFAHAVLAPRVIEPLLRIEPLAWHIDGADVVATGSPASSTGLRHRLQILHEVATNIPTYLYRS